MAKSEFELQLELVNGLRASIAQLEKSADNWRSMSDTNYSRSEVHRARAESLAARESLLLECVRWCITNGAYLVNGEISTERWKESVPPAHLAPLIAEALKEK